MFDNDDSESEGDGSLPVDRRRLLIGTAAAGSSLGLTGCTAGVDRDYEATPVTVPEETARAHGFVPEPRNDSETVSVDRSVGGVLSVRANVTSHIRQYEYRGTTAAEGAAGDGESEGGGEAPTTATRGTDIEDDAVEATFGQFLDGSSGGDEGSGDRVSDYDGSDESSDGRGDADGGGADDRDGGVDAGDGDAGDRGGAGDDESATGGETGEGGRDDGGDDGAVTNTRSEDTFVLAALPDPSIAGQSLSPAARASIKELIQEHTGAFEAVCGCDVGDTGEVTVETASGPDATIALDDVGDIVYAIDVSDTPSLPDTVPLLGEDRPLRYFAFATDANSVNVHLVMAAKAGYQPPGGGRETVIASYVAKRHRADLGGPTTLISSSESGSGGGEGLYTASEVQGFADRFRPVCASSVPEAPQVGEIEEGDCEELKQQLKKLRRKLREKEEQLASLEAERAKTQRKLGDVEGQLEDAREQRQKKSQEFDRLYDQFKRFMDAQGVEAKKYDKGSDPDTGEKANFVGTSNEGASQGIGIAFDDPQAAEDALDGYSDSFDNDVGDDINRMNELQRDLTELNNTIDGLEQERNDLRDEIDDLDRKISDCEDEIGQLKRDIEQLKNEIEKCEDRLDRKDEYDDALEPWEGEDGLISWVEGFGEEIEETGDVVDESKGTTAQKEADSDTIDRARTCHQEARQIARQAAKVADELGEADGETFRRKKDRLEELRRKLQEKREECRGYLEEAEENARSRKCPPPGETVKNRRETCYWYGIEEIQTVFSLDPTMTPEEYDDEIKRFKRGLEWVKRSYQLFNPDPSQIGVPTPPGAGDAAEWAAGDEASLVDFDKVFDPPTSRGVSVLSPIDVADFIDWVKNEGEDIREDARPMQVWATYTGALVEEITKEVCVDGAFEERTEYRYASGSEIECTQHVATKYIGGSEERQRTALNDAVQTAMNKVGNPGQECGKCVENGDYE